MGMYLIQITEYSFFTNITLKGIQLLGISSSTVRKHPEILNVFLDSAMPQFFRSSSAQYSCGDISFLVYHQKSHDKSSNFLCTFAMKARKL